MNAEQLEQERADFEAAFPPPANVMWCGRRYAPTEYNAWTANDYCQKWDGWIARAQQQVASGVPGGLNALQERWLMDAGRDAYDCGYNDARDACAKPGDGAPGYRGREIERKTRDNFSRVIAQAATPTAPAQRASAVPDGFKLVAVKGFDELVEALARAARKSYLPDAMADEWAALDWHTVATPTAPADVMADAELQELREWQRLAFVAHPNIDIDIDAARAAEKGTT